MPYSFHWKINSLVFVHLTYNYLICQLQGCTIRAGLTIRLTRLKPIEPLMFLYPPIEGKKVCRKCNVAWYIEPKYYHVKIHLTFFIFYSAKQVRRLGERRRLDVFHLSYEQKSQTDFSIQMVELHHWTAAHNLFSLEPITSKRRKHVNMCSRRNYTGLPRPYRPTKVTKFV